MDVIISNAGKLELRNHAYLFDNIMKKGQVDEKIRDKVGIGRNRRNYSDTDIETFKGDYFDCLRKNI